VRELEKKLLLITQERDQLQRDVETLCLQNGSSMFSASYVLTERIKATDAELKDVRSTNLQLTLDCDSLKDELTTLRSAKTTTDALVAEQSRRLGQLEKDLAFFQVQVSKSVSERDQALYETDRLKAAAAKSDAILKDLQARTEADAAARASLEQQLAAARSQVEQQRRDLDTMAADVEAAERKLRQAADEKRKLQNSTHTLQAKVDEYLADLERTKRQLQQFRESEGQLRVDLQKSSATTAQLQGTVAGQTEKISTLVSELETRDRELAAARQEVGTARQEAGSAQRQVQELQQQLEEQQQELNGQVRQVQADLADREKQLQEQRQRQLALERQLQQQRKLTAAAGRAVSTEPAAPNRHASAAGGAAADGNSATPRSAEKKKHDGSGPGDQSSASIDEQHDHDDGGDHGPHSGLREDEREQLQILSQMVRDLKLKLAQATQEKVQALLKVAEARQDAEGGGAGNGPGPAGAAAGHPPRPHGSHPNLPAASSSAAPGFTSVWGFGGQGSRATGGTASGGGVLSSSPVNPSGGFFSNFMSARFGGASTPDAAAPGGQGPPAQSPGAAGAAVGAAAGAHKQAKQHVNHPHTAHLSLGLPSGEPAEEGAGARKGTSSGAASISSSPAAAAQHSAAHTSSSLAGETLQGLGVPAGALAQLMSGNPLEAGVAGGGAAAGLVAEVSALQAQVAVAQRVAESAHRYMAQLKAAGKVVWSKVDAAKKWSALTDLSKLHEELNRLRAKMGLPRGEEGAPAHMRTRSEPFKRSSVTPEQQAAELLERTLLSEVLALVEFGVHALEQYNQQEALTSLNMPYT